MQIIEVFTSGSEFSCYSSRRFGYIPSVGWIRTLYGFDCIEMNFNLSQCGQLKPFMQVLGFATS